MIIEVTGVAFPDKIAEAIFKDVGIASRMVTIVDARRRNRIRILLENLIDRQLNNAHMILLNKGGRVRIDQY